MASSNVDVSEYIRKIIREERKIATPTQESVGVKRSLRNPNYAKTSTDPFSMGTVGIDGIGNLTAAP